MAAEARLAGVSQDGEPGARDNLQRPARLRPDNSDQ